MKYRPNSPDDGASDGTNSDGKGNDGTTNHPAAGGRKLHWYVNQMMTTWKAVLAVLIPLALVGASIGIGGLDFSAQLSINFLPSPALTDVYNAYAEFQQNNPIFINGDIEAVLLARVDGSDVLDANLSVTAKQIGSEVISAINSSTIGSDMVAPLIRWYYTYVVDDPELYFLSKQYVFPNSAAMAIALKFDDSDDVTDAEIDNIMDAVNGVQEKHPTDESGWQVTATGRQHTHFLERRCQNALVHCQVASKMQMANAMQMHLQMVLCKC